MHFSPLIFKALCIAASVLIIRFKVVPKLFRVLIEQMFGIIYREVVAQNSPRKTYRKTLMAVRPLLLLILLCLCCFQKLASCTTTSSLPLFIILTRNLLVRHLQTDYREKTIENEAGNSSLLPNCPLPPFEIKICSTHTFLLDTMLYRIIRVKHTVLN